MNEIEKLVNLFDLNDHVIMVTGVAGQLGRTLTTAILNADAKVLGLDTSMSKMNEVSEENNWADDNLLLIEADIRERIQVENAFKEGLAKFGCLTGQINNAGVSVFEPWIDRSDEDFDWVTQVNLKGTFNCIRAFLGCCKKNDREGAIVNIASHYGLISPDPRIYTDCQRRNSEVYGATKAGVIQMTKYFSVNSFIEGANVRVNAVAPGGILNPWDPQGEDFQKLYGDRCPMGRMAELSEMIGPILFLLSSAASYVNGHTFVVDGGMTAW